jgi:hypothetical protein
MAEVQRIGYAERPPRFTVTAWLLAFASPLVFLTVLGVRFTIAGAVCDETWVRTALELTAGVGLLVIAAVGLTSRARLRSDPPDRRSERMLVEVGIFLSIFSLIATLMVWLPTWALPLCHV